MSFLLNLKPIFEPTRPLKVICIGAGASGLLLAYKIQRHFDNFELDVYEKNPEVSGTWFENRYPGCACDVPSHCYTWSFEPKTDWSATYASSEEIHQYFTDFMHKYGLEKYVKTQHAVSNAVWNEDTAQWDVTIDDLATGKQIHKSANILINGAGILNAWRYPPIPGLKEYKGALVHSAAWDPTIELEGKVVGLIGNGSSGIQILPAIKDKVKELITFIREPTYVAPPVGQGYKVYSAEERAHFAADPKYHLQMRKEIEAGMNGTFGIFHAGSPAQKMVREHMVSEMKRKLNNPKLEKLLTPEWSVGCRRITPGTNYLESLSAPNVKVVYGEIDKITEKGPIVDDGNEYPVDVLICATGFDTTFKPRFPLIGTTGEKLNEVWKDEPKGYLGIAVNNYPNYFMTLGPNCPIGNGPVLISIEAEVDYIIKMLSKFQKENIRSFDVKPEPVQEFNDWKEKFMSGTIWVEECRSWYKSGNIHGKIAALWPGSTMHYLEALKDPRWEDWKFQYMSNNRFEYLGNGHSSSEKREGGSLSYYIRDHDDDEIDIVLKKPSKVHPELEGIVPSRDAIRAKLN